MEKPPVLVVFTSQRSGSNYLNSLVEQCWTYGYVGEWLNPTFEPEERKLMQVPDSANILQYLASIRAARGTPGKGWAIKLMPDHWRSALDRYRKEIWPDLSEESIYESCFPEAIPVYLKRKDVVAQAVSFAIAELTDQWIVYKDQEVGQASELKYNRKVIRKFVQQIDEDNAYWEEFFQRLGLSPLRVSYESLVENPLMVLQKILECGPYPVEPSKLPQKSRTRKQASSVNSEWIERFKAETAR